ncbi:MAG: transglycosylase domain-containing protein [Alphaproteobacteria bacterium]
MRIHKFKYKLSNGAKSFHCGPAYHKKIRGFKYTKGIWGKVFYYFVCCGIWVGIILSVVLLYLALTLPNIEHITNQTRKPSITIVDRNNQKITSINDIYGETVEVESLPPHIWQAIVAVEDKRFYSHFGVDIKGLFRAVVNNIRKSRAAQGGSTITQQVAKNVFLSSERSISRKIQEVMITFWLEHKFTKNQILSLYLNRVSLVGGKYGIANAAEALFNKSVYDINVAEAAILAGMLKAPTRLNPMNNPEASLNRAKIVISLMKEQNYITDSQYEEAMKYQYVAPSNKHNLVRYYIDYTLNEMNSLVSDFSKDIVIHTTLDNNIQKTAENVAKTYMEKNGERYNFSQVAMVVMNTDGNILAMIGGKDYTQSQFNRTNQMKRQPGSAFKPFVYLAALEKGFKPTDMFEDKLTTIENWTPKNHDEKYIGAISMADALEKSVNTVPVQIAKQIGLKSIIAMARKLGLIDRISNDYTIILGTSETTLLDLTSAYATFANKGYGVIPHSIVKITDASGNVIYERSGSGVGKLLSNQEVENMNYMLRRVIQGGTGANANIYGTYICGKTGTSQNNRDAWFIGYSPDYIAGVWIGNDNNEAMSNSSYGGTIPAKIFKAIMSYIISTNPS